VAERGGAGHGNALAARDPESFHVRRDDSGALVLSGVIDESADLSFLTGLAGHNRLLMRRVRRINSYGVRAWIEAMRHVPPGATFELLECPPAVVDQLNMVAGFVGPGQVTSFYAPMACDACGHDLDQLFEVAQYRQAGRLPDVPCPRCGERMHVDDLEEQYLMFAREGSG